MSRYVDIEGDWVDEAIKTYSLGYYDYDEYAIPFDALGSAPTIDIVRCSECKHWRTKYFEGGHGWCEWHINHTKADDFCSFGCRSEKPNNSERSSK